MPMIAPAGVRTMRSPCWRTSRADMSPPSRDDDHAAREKLQRVAITQAREPRQHRQHRRKHRRGNERCHNGRAGGKIQMTEHRMRFLLEPSDQAWRAWERQQLRKIPPPCMEYLGAGDSRHLAVYWHA